MSIQAFSPAYFPAPQPVPMDVDCSVNSFKENESLPTASFSIGFDPVMLWSALRYGEGTPKEIGQVIEEDDPDIFSSISNLTEEQLFSIFSGEIAVEEEAIQLQMKQKLAALYAMSLCESRYNEMTVTLEKRKNSYFILSEKENFQRLIDQATEILSEKPAMILEEYQDYLCNLGKIAGEIVATLNLFQYIDPEVHSRVKTLIEKTVDGNGIPLFPRSKESFGIFCQNLTIARNEESQLKALRASLLQRTQQIREVLPSFYANETAMIAPQDRKSLLDNEAVLFWKIGTQILDNAFRETFDTNKLNGVYRLPDLEKAVKKASKLPGYQHLNWKALTKGPILRLPEQYLHEVWFDFLGSPDIMDMQDFMSRLLRSLPEETFQQLKTALRSSQDKKETLLHALSAHIKSQYRGPITFQMLKNLTRKRNF